MSIRDEFTDFLKEKNLFDDKVPSLLALHKETTLSAAVDDMQETNWEKISIPLIKKWLAHRELRSCATAIAAFSHAKLPEGFSLEDLAEHEDPETLIDVLIIERTVIFSAEDCKLFILSNKSPQETKSLLSMLDASNPPLAFSIKLQIVNHPETFPLLRIVLLLALHSVLNEVICTLLYQQKNLNQYEEALFNIPPSALNEEAVRTLLTLPSEVAVEAAKQIRQGAIAPALAFLEEYGIKEKYMAIITDDPDPLTTAHQLIAAKKILAENALSCLTANRIEINSTVVKKHLNPENFANAMVYFVNLTRLPSDPTINITPEQYEQLVDHSTPSKIIPLLELIKTKTPPENFQENFDALMENFDILIQDPICDCVASFTQDAIFNQKIYGDIIELCDTAFSPNNAIVDYIRSLEALTPTTYCELPSKEMDFLNLLLSSLQKNKEQNQNILNSNDLTRHILSYPSVQQKLAEIRKKNKFSQEVFNHLIELCESPKFFDERKIIRQINAYLDTFLFSHPLTPAIYSSPTASNTSSSSMVSPTTVDGPSMKAEETGEDQSPADPDALVPEDSSTEQPTHKFSVGVEL